MKRDYILLCPLFALAALFAACGRDGGKDKIKDTEEAPEVETVAQQVAIEKAEEPVPDQTVLAETTPRSPVAVAGVFDKETDEVVLKVAIHDGFHIYAIVDQTDPFITTTVSLELPEGVKADGNLIRPQMKGTANNTAYYVGNVEFRQKVTGDIGGVATWTIRFQCCDNSVCLTPETRTVKVVL